MHRHGASTVETKAATQINLFSYCATPSRGLEKLPGITTFLRHYYSRRTCLPPWSGREQMEQNCELVILNGGQPRSGRRRRRSASSAGKIREAGAAARRLTDAGRDS